MTQFRLNPQQVRNLCDCWTGLSTDAKPIGFSTAKR